MDQARGKPLTPAQNRTTRQAGCRQPTNANGPSPFEGAFKSALSLKGGSHSEHDAFQIFPTTAGIRTNYLTNVSLNEQTICQRSSQIQRRLERLEWLCFDDKCNKLDTLSCSFRLVGVFTSVQVSCAQTFHHLAPIRCSTIQQETSREDVVFQLKERGFDVAFATKRCHSRQSEVVFFQIQLPAKRQ